MPSSNKTKLFQAEAQVEVQPKESLEIPVREHYELHLDGTEATSVASSPELSSPQKPAASKKVLVPQQKVQKTISLNQTPQKKSYRVWRFLEWFGTSALIFLVFFVIINFGSYSDVLQIKINKWFGNFQTNPYIEKASSTQQKPAAQELLPIPDLTQKRTLQVPPLTLEIAPPDERIIIPSINKNIPIVQISDENLRQKDWGALEQDIQNALRDGVVHYPDTANPGDPGNVVITGHSSYFPWDPGRFKDAFAPLHEVHEGDQIIIYYNQKKYEYVIYEITKVDPNQIDVLLQEGEPHLTLITCTPIGTNWRRLVVKARPVA